MIKSPMFRCPIPIKKPNYSKNKNFYFICSSCLRLCLRMAKRPTERNFHMAKKGKLSTLFPIINRPGVAGAVLQTALSLIN